MGLGTALLSRALQRALATPVRQASGLQGQGWWIPDHKPRRLPETKEERRQAALKYGLREEDYEPYPMGPGCVGEYPDLGPVAHIHKDPYENWSHEHYRRNFGEPVPFDFKNIQPDRKNFSGLEHDEIGWNAFMPTIYFATGFMFFVYLLLATDIGGFPWVSQPMMPKQLPFDFKRAYPWEDPAKYPITNYTFEPASK